MNLKDKRKLAKDSKARYAAVKLLTCDGESYQHYGEPQLTTEQYGKETFAIVIETLGKNCEYANLYFPVRNNLIRGTEIDLYTLLAQDPNFPNAAYMNSVTDFKLEA